MRALIRRHAATSYFVLAFAISWGGILAQVGVHGILAPPEVFASMRWVPALVAGPLIAGLVMTWLVLGTPGLQMYRTRLTRWRVGGRWYVAALATAPVYFLLASLLMSAYAPGYLPGVATAPDPVAVVVRGVIGGLAAGVFEEAGWTGFAVPILRRRYGAMMTGTIVGVLWGIWHILPKLLGVRAFGIMPYIAIDMLTAIVSLTGYRILMVWLYDRTGSLLLAMLMHAALTASMLIVQPVVAGTAQITVEIVLAVVPWLVVAVVAAIRNADALRRHAAATYFVLTFTISWGLLLLVTGPRILGSAEDFERLFPLAVPLLVLGPSISGLFMTWFIGGRRGLRVFGRRLVRFRVDARWYAVALLTAPVYFLITMLAMSLHDRQFLPALIAVDDRTTLAVRGLAVALVAGIVEELGWTGFAIPALRRRHSAFSTGLFVGVMWGAWHLLPKIWGAAAHGLVGDMPGDLASAVLGLAGYRILMVWVYDRTHSLAIAILMHFALTASTLILQPAITGSPLVTMGLALVVAVWVVVGLTALVHRTRTSWHANHPGFA